MRIRSTVYLPEDALGVVEVRYPPWAAAELPDESSVVFIHVECRRSVVNHFPPRGIVIIGIPIITSVYVVYRYIVRRLDHVYIINVTVFRTILFQ